jgi:hypothetical protein
VETVSALGGTEEGGCWAQLQQVNASIAAQPVSHLIVMESPRKATILNVPGCEKILNNCRTKMKPD